VSSRLAIDPFGRLVAVVTAPAVGLEVGMRFLVLGNEIPVAEPVRFSWVGTGTGRAPLPAETPRRNGTGRTNGSTPRKWTDAERAQAVELVANGASWAQAAECLGCSKASVGEWVRAER
jgi:hypothetical protein